MSQDIASEEFWIVWSPTGMPPPRVRHRSEYEAQQAAEAMAKRHRGQLFFVLRALECYLLPQDEQPVRARLLEDHGIPF